MSTPAFDARSYDSTVRAARQWATELNCEVGLERNPLFKTFNIFLLPAPQHRSGHELRCEVIRPGEPL